MITRESSRQQDTGDQPETAVQGRPSRSIYKAKALWLVPCKPGVVAELLIANHYLHAMNSAPQQCFAVYADKTQSALVGGIVYTVGSRDSHTFLTGGLPGQVGTLGRYYLSDECEPNSESRMLSLSLKKVSDLVPHWKAVVSYADPSYGHRGIIYQATGWRYVGVSHPSAYIIVNGKRYHPRSLFSKFHTNDLGVMRRAGLDVRREAEPAKHIYVYCLDRSWLWRMPKALPYPKGG